MDKKTFYKHLVDRYVAKTLTDEELEVFVALVKQGELDEQLSRAMEEAEQNFDAEQDLPALPETRRLWPMIAIAAAIFFAAVLGVLFFYHQIGNKSTDFNYVSNDINPGGNGATLTLSNGKVILLSNENKGVRINSGALTYDDGSYVIQGVDGEVNSKAGLVEIKATTARGQTYMVVLQDGTKVWLNAASTLVFPSTFSASGKRVVSLEGEAYFEVFKDKSHPFIVKLEKHNQVPAHEINVLGTHFNVNAYKDESSIKTTLLEGSVRVATLSGNMEAILKPNQQSILSSSSQLYVKNVDASLSVDWKNGSFVFQGEKLGELMKRVGRWYDVEIVYKNSAIKDQKFTGEISKYDQVSELLRILQRTDRVKFEIEGRKIIVSN